MCPKCHIDPYQKFEGDYFLKTCFFTYIKFIQDLFFHKCELTEVKVQFYPYIAAVFLKPCVSIFGYFHYLNHYN